MLLIGAQKKIPEEFVTWQTRSIKASIAHHRWLTTGGLIKVVDRARRMSWQSTVVGQQLLSMYYLFKHVSLSNAQS
jgi:hypothetical protein